MHSWQFDRKRGSGKDGPDKNFWDQLDFAKEALDLCSYVSSAQVGEYFFAAPGPLIETYKQLAGTPYAERLALAVADLLDAPEGDVRVVAVHFFALWPTAAGHERVLDIIEDGPRHGVTDDGGQILDTPADDNEPIYIRECFEQVLTKLAALGHPRAQALMARSDLAKLLERTSKKNHTSQ